MKKAGARGRVAGSAAAAAGRQDWRWAPAAEGWPLAEGASVPVPGVLALGRNAPPSWSVAWGVAAPLRAALAWGSVWRRLRTVSAVTSPWTRNTGRLPAADGAGAAVSWAAPPPVSPPAVVRLPADWLRKGTTRAARSRAAA